MEENRKVGVVSFVAAPFAGPEDTVTLGAIVSTVKSREATAMFWAVSVALTVNLWSPSVSVAVVNGEVQATKGSPSIRH